MINKSDAGMMRSHLICDPLRLQFFPALKQLIIEICKIDQIFARFLWIKIYFLIPSEAYITVLISIPILSLLTFASERKVMNCYKRELMIKLIEVIYLKKLCWIYAQKIKTFLSFPPRTTSLWSPGKIKRLTTSQRFRSLNDFHFYFLYPEIFK